MFNKYDFNSNFSFNNAVPCLGDCELYFKQICISDNKVILTLICFLEYQDVINLKLTCKRIFKKINKKLIKSYIRSGCITNKSRKIFWINNIDYHNMEELIKKEKNFLDDNIYTRLIELSNIEKIKNNLFFKICEEINRDLYRTFHEGKFNTQEGQDELGRVLTAIAYIRPEIGYCQGMNFVAGGLLYFMESEELTFWIFLSLLDTMELNSLYYKVLRLLHRICLIIA